MRHELRAFFAVLLFASAGAIASDGAAPPCAWPKDRHISASAPIVPIDAMPAPAAPRRHLLLPECAFSPGGATGSSRPIEPDRPAEALSRLHPLPAPKSTLRLLAEPTVPAPLAVSLPISRSPPRPLRAIVCLVIPA